MLKNILIIEDDEIQLNGIKATLKNYDKNFVIYTTTNDLDAAKIYESQTIDLFFLDVDLTNAGSDETGIDIGKKLRTLDRYKTTPIIYITGVPEMIHSAVNDIHCFNYISKPYKEEHIIKALQDLSTPDAPGTSAITIRDLNGVSTTLKCKDIIYVRTEGHIQNIYTLTGPFSTRVKNIKDLLSELPEYFIQIHKSHIINCQYIKSYDKTMCMVSVGTISLPVGRSYKKDFDALMEDRNGF